MAQSIRALDQVDIDRLTAAVFVPSLPEVYLGILQNSTIPWRTLIGKRCRRQFCLN